MTDIRDHATTKCNIVSPYTDCDIKILLWMGNIPAYHRVDRQLAAKAGHRRGQAQGVARKHPTDHKRRNVTGSNDGLMHCRECS